MIDVINCFVLRDDEACLICMILLSFGCTEKLRDRNAEASCVQTSRQPLSSASSILCIRLPVI